MMAIVIRIVMLIIIIVVSKKRTVTGKSLSKRYKESDLFCSCFGLPAQVTFGA